MSSILEFLNRIRWDKNLSPEEYCIFYLDRIMKIRSKPDFQDAEKGKPFSCITKGLIEIKYKDIKKVGKKFMIAEKNNKEVSIPLHRIRKIERKGKLVWERKKS